MNKLLPFSFLVLLLLNTNVFADSSTTLNQPVNKIKDKSEFSCGKKRFCNKMNSCKEANFYLKKCGLKRLDRDNDGIPCESLCR